MKIRINFRKFPEIFRRKFPNSQPSLQLSMWASSLRDNVTRKNPRDSGSTREVRHACVHAQEGSDPKGTARNMNYYTVSQKKTKQICFCQNFVKFAPILIIFGRKMGNDPNICEVHSSPPYRVKRKCSKLLHNAEIISNRSLTLATSIQ